MTFSNRLRRKKGIALIVGTISLVMIVPLLGLSIDVATLYVVRSRVQSSVDGAALAAARALNLGQSTNAQITSAKQNAVNWFYSNFPAGNWGTANTIMDANTVQVFDDPNNPNLRNVTVTATTSAPTYFMRYLNAVWTTVSATGNASRRDAVVMMVLDRSGSMGSACGNMLTAAKLFTGQFAAGRDRIGLVSFSDNVYLHSAPTQNFQTVLGYSNSQGSAVGEIDTIVCSGGTSTAQAMSVGYNELYKTMLPGALNVLMIETDGLPNTLTLNWWDSAAATAGISTNSNCIDAGTPARKKSAGGFASATALPNWTPGRNLGTGSYFGNIPGGIVGSLASADPGGSSNFFVLFPYWTTVKTGNYNSSSYLTSSTAPGCNFLSTHTPTNLTGSSADFAWLPNTDVYGNSLNTGWKSITTSGTHIAANSWTTYHNGVSNATDHAAYRMRTNVTLPVHVFGIGFTSAVDFVLMQRMTNDPDGDNFNIPAQYLPCASTAGCVNYPTQPQGTFIYSTVQSALNQAFLQLSSQILRLSQ